MAITTNDVKLDALLAELQRQIETLSEGKALYAAEIGSLQAKLKTLEISKSKANENT